MIEGLIIRNELTLKRWRRFKRNRTAMMWVWVLLIITFFSFTAEFWANSKPILLKYKDEIYAPIFNDYHPTIFGREDIFVMDYRNLTLGENEWVIWPIVKWDAYESNKNVENYPAPPSASNWFGTDDRGRDVFARLLYGFRYSIAYAFGVWLLSYMLGTFFGALMGYAGGKTDLAGSRFVEVIEMMPQLLLLHLLHNQ